MAEIAKVCSSPHWLELLHDAKAIHPELRIVQLRKNKLMVGACDLYVEKNSGEILVVEWKTMSPRPNSELMNFAVQNGFTQQLNQYLRAVRALKPQAQVTGWLWFTKSEKLIRFGKVD